MAEIKDVEMASPEKKEKKSKSEKKEKKEKKEKAAKAEKPEKAEKVEKAEKADKEDKKKEKVDKAEKSSKKSKVKATAVAPDDAMDIDPTPSASTDKATEKGKKTKTSKKTSKKAVQLDQLPLPKAVDPKTLAPIAQPLAQPELYRTILKLVRTAAKQRHVKRGVKEVVKGIRKGDKGLVIIAGDISPIDVISHVPVLCEEASMPYCYVPSKEHLGAAGATKRSTSIVLILANKPKAEYTDALKECITAVQKMEIPMGKKVLH